MPVNPLRTLIAQLYHLIFAIRPPADFILTGLPRSGTSLLSALLSESNTCFCFNEIYYDPNSLPLFYTRMRRRLLHNRPIPVKVDSTGDLTTDTLVGKVAVKWKTFNTKQKPLVLGSNVNIPYLDRIDELLTYRYRIIAMIRDPVYTLASWGSEKGKKIPEGHVTDDDMNPRWRRFSFDSDDAVERRAVIWQYYAALLADRKDALTIIRYEDLCDHQELTLKNICQVLGIMEPQKKVPLQNLNQNDRFSHIEGIREVVSLRCPARKEFGYEN